MSPVYKSYHSEFMSSNSEHQQYLKGVIKPIASRNTKNDMNTLPEPTK